MLFGFRASASSWFGESPRFGVSPAIEPQFACSPGPRRFGPAPGFRAAKAGRVEIRCAWNPVLTRASRNQPRTASGRSRLGKPPPRPSVPVASEDEFFDDDITIEDTDFDDFEDWDSPPPPSEGPNVKFIPYDKPPKPIIPISPVYPDIAQEAGIEGTIYIQFFIDINGNVTEAWVQKGIPNTGLNEAALTAVKQSKWQPAQRRDKKVGVWQTVPVKFELTSH